MAQQGVLDQGTSIIEMVTAEEVPVSFCIIFKNLKATLAYLESFFKFLVCPDTITYINIKIIEITMARTPKRNYEA